MSFHNYSLGRHIALSLSHGDDWWNSNSARITAEEEAWLRENFMALKEAFGKVRPQQAWFIKYPFVSYMLFVSPVGMLLRHFVVDPLWRFFDSTGSYGEAQSFVRGLIGASIAFVVYEWLAKAWPSVEFDFGSAHLRTERTRRNRISAVVTLIILPLAITLAVEWFKAPK